MTQSLTKSFAVVHAQRESIGTERKTKGISNFRDFEFFNFNYARVSF